MCTNEQIQVCSVKTAECWTLSFYKCIYVTKHIENWLFFNQVDIDQIWWSYSNAIIHYHCHITVFQILSERLELTCRVWFLARGEDWHVELGFKVKGVGFKVSVMGTVRRAVCDACTVHVLWLLMGKKLMCLTAIHFNSFCRSFGVHYFISAGSSARMKTACYPRTCCLFSLSYGWNVFPWQVTIITDCM